MLTCAHWEKTIGALLAFGVTVVAISKGINITQRAKDQQQSKQYHGLLFYMTLNYSSKKMWQIKQETRRIWTAGASRNCVKACLWTSCLSVHRDLFSPPLFSMAGENRWKTHMSLFRDDTKSINLIFRQLKEGQS